MIRNKHELNLFELCLCIVFVIIGLGMSYVEAGICKIIEFYKVTLFAVINYSKYESGIMGGK